MAKDTTSGLYRVGGDVTAPKPIHFADPKYTKEAREAHLQGEVVLSLVVGPDGKPHDIKVQRSLGMGLDEEAMKAVEKWRFQPSMKEGRPVPVMINQGIYFRLWNDLAPPLATTGDPYRPSVTFTWSEVNKSKYPLLVRVSAGYFSGSGISAATTYEAVITDAGQQREMPISCIVTAPHCLVLGDGMYPARWQENMKKLEILGISKTKLDWDKSEYTVVDRH
ncbi:MAG: energy transducer TonB [Terriglobales bacterium]